MKLTKHYIIHNGAPVAFTYCPALKVGESSEVLAARDTSNGQLVNASAMRLSRAQKWAEWEERHRADLPYAERINPNSTTGFYRRFRIVGE